MIRIELDEPTLSRTRIAISPLGELVCGLYLLRRHAEAPWPYTSWAVRAREVLRTEPATAPLALYFQLPSRSPDFLDPVPETALPTFAEQLDRLRATPAEVIAEQFATYHPDGDLPEFLRPFRDDRQAALDRLAGGLAANQRWQGTLEMIMLAPRRPVLVVLPITAATALTGTYALLATLLWGRLIYGIRLDFAHPLRFLAAALACVAGLGMFGLLLASTFVLIRNANALANPLDYPIWLLSGMLVPVSVLPS
ncbi:ABC transporter permease [Actinoplanes awajinensis]|uniref:ABC-2 type transporter transmembrane domain-containing protein n=1 Tax=Actinoplanes awajinensis subsp. mycoplanecinus TaxID=135947 RepID=A0A0X3VCJ6_9ACTN|nr:ABC transporter permease [Actinoplanes awajinensis]KUL42521.1 hypothetical protein ADL15_01210 [Actinoplanes awajinensis subsp. mycoplanecinus]